MAGQGRTRSGALVRRGLVVAATLLAVPAVAGTAGAIQPAATGETGLITISPATQTQPSGTAQTYTINVSCQGTAGGACGPNLTVTIPLDPTTTPPMTDPSWTYSALSTPGTLLASGPTVVGSDLVLTLDPAVFVSGFSGGITLKATPPAGTTPNRTTWQMAPTLTGDRIDPVSAPVPAASTATAAPKVSIAKATADGGSVYTVGSTVTYSMTVRCTPVGPGGLYLTTATVADPLPAGMTYVSSTPPGGTYDAASHTVTWTFSAGDPTTMPAGCSPGATGPTAFSVTATAPGTVPANPQLINTASFSGTGPDAQNPAGVSSTSTAQVPIQVLAEPNVGPGVGYAQITKSSLAPVAQSGITSGNQYVGTFAGNWLPAGASPSYATTAAAAMYQTTVTYGLVGTYATDLVDPVPCLVAPSGNVYSSSSPSGPVCTQPAFHTQVVQVTSPGWDPSTNGLGQAYAGGWRPTVTLTDGTVVALTATGTVSPTAGSAYFAVPPGADVALVRLPPDPALRTKSLQLTLWGYADGSLGDVHNGINQLHNTATATPEITPGTPLAPTSASADLFTIPSQPQLGIAKSFGAPGAAAGGTTQLNLSGSVATLAGLTRPLVITDLLPTGIRWANPATSGTWTLTKGGGSPAGTTPVSVEVIDDYQGSGRQLIRATVPAASIPSGGGWTVTPPSGYFRVTTPAAIGAYVNTDQIFLAGSPTGTVQDTCATPTQTGGGISPATYQTDNPADLAGDGRLQEPYCQNQAVLTIKGTGAAFALTKTVQGDLDAVARGALGVGNASPGGTGTFRLAWTNVGSNVLGQAVVYDLLPHPGDTGVSQGQSGVARNSQFTPVLASVGALPAGVTLAYSASDNPCRDEVFPTAANPGCADDWSTTPPADLSTVRALRFRSSATYQVGQGFAVAFTVTVPPTDINAIAWNSAATNAVDVANPANRLLPAEPPKVGIMAPVAPLLTTATSAPVATAFAPVTDQVTVAGTGGGPGSLAWNLVGPLEPVGNACTGLDWSAAPAAAHGTVPVAGDGTVTVGPTALGSGGCWSWSYVLTSTDADRPYRATAEAGAPGEQTIATPYPPSIATTAELTIDGAGVRILHDHITIDDIPVAAPAPSPLTWTLYGPLTPGTGRSCQGLDWSAASVRATGTVPVTGNGTYDTPAEHLTAATPGCYSYGVVLPATADSPAASEPAGQPAETVLVADPEVITSTAPTVALWASTTDSVTVAGTEGGTGTLAWTLVGPVAPVAGSCARADWTGAATAAQGTVDVPGDGTYVTDAVTPDRPGCWSWTDVLTSATFPSPTETGPGAPDESFLVTPLRPTLATTAATATESGTAPGQVPVTDVTDTISLTGSGLSTHPTAPAAASVRWALFGPLAPRAGSCAGLTWSGAPVAGAGAIEVTRDGTVATGPTRVANAGCYSYEVELAASAVADGATSLPGSTSETILLAATPIVPPDANGSHTSPSGSHLAMTGADVLRLLGLGALLVGVGAAVQLRRRRRTA